MNAETERHEREHSGSLRDGADLAALRSAIAFARRARRGLIRVSGTLLVLAVAFIAALTSAAGNPFWDCVAAAAASAVPISLWLLVFVIGIGELAIVQSPLNAAWRSYMHGAERAVRADARAQSAHDPRAVPRTDKS